MYYVGVAACNKFQNFIDTLVDFIDIPVDFIDTLVAFIDTLVYFIDTLVKIIATLVDFIDILVDLRGQGGLHIKSTFWLFLIEEADIYQMLLVP